MTEIAISFKVFLGSHDSDSCAGILALHMTLVPFHYLVKMWAKSSGEKISCSPTLVRCILKLRNTILVVFAAEP